MSERPLVLYHAQCADGFCAAWAAWRKLGDGADYLPVQYGTEPPDVRGRDVYVLDFSYKRPVMVRLAAVARSLTILDHHKTAQAELDGLSTVITGQNARFPVVVFDMDKSGGRLAWEYFHPDEEAPFLVDVTEDRDLWRWKLPRSRELSAWLASAPRTFEAWTIFSSELTRPWRDSDGERWIYDGLTEDAVEQGAAILRYQQTVIDVHVANAVEIELDGYKVLSLNATTMFSEIAGKLAEDRPFGATWFVRQDGKKVWSLRSREGGVDVSEIARRHGGGGHKQAAGFEE